MMDEDTARRLYRAGIEEEVRHMKSVWDEMKDNPESPLRNAAYEYYAELLKEQDRIHREDNQRAIEATRGLWR